MDSMLGLGKYLNNLETHIFNVKDIANVVITKINGYRNMYIDYITHINEHKRN